MATHVAIDKDRCKECKAAIELARKSMGRGFFGWCKGAKKDMSGKRDDEDRELPINEVVKRRIEWKEEVDARKARREEKRLSMRTALG